MDHSVRAYLEKLPVEKLDSLLRACLQEGRRESYAHMIPDILDVLVQREEEGNAIPVHLWQVRELYLEKKR